MVMRFSGFSTKNKKAINHVLTGKEVVIEDLMNHIMTRKGERVMMPEFGSIIHEMKFEPLDTETKIVIEEDLTDIVNQEPRADLLSVVVTDDEHSITANITINVLPANEVAELTINLERE